MEQVRDSLHFFGTNSRNLSRGVQHTPFTRVTLFKSLTPEKEGSYAAQQKLWLIHKLRVSRQTWIHVLISASNKIWDRAGGVFLSHKPKNKGPCVRPSVCGSQAPAVSMPLLRDSSCWPDIAWLGKRPQCWNQPCSFTGSLSLSGFLGTTGSKVSTVFFEDGRWKFESSVSPLMWN